MEACNPAENSSLEGQPLEITDYWIRVNMWRCTDYSVYNIPYGSLGKKPTLSVMKCLRMIHNLVTLNRLIITLTWSAHFKIV